VRSVTGNESSAVTARSSGAESRRSSIRSTNRKGSYAFIPNGKNDDRSAYIREGRRCQDLIYDIPGMGDVTKNAVKTPRFDTTSQSQRFQYVTQTPFPTGLYYDLPGMAQKPATKAVDFRKQSHVTDRATYIPVARPSQDVGFIALPGIAEDVTKSNKGTLAFRLTTRRDSYIRSGAKPHDLMYDIPGVADMVLKDKVHGAFRATSPRTRPLSPPKKGEAYSVCAYNVPGMAEEVSRSKHGSLAFRTSSDRSSFIRAFPKTNDLVYDVPGMSGIVYEKPTPRRSSAVAAAERERLTRQDQTPPTPPPVRRYDSPTRCSAARQDAVERDMRFFRQK